MFGNPQRRRTEEVCELRREGGRWLKTQRERRGLSQRELATLVGSEHYSFISQLENGRGRIPPERYEAWSAAFGMANGRFVREILRFYDPIAHRMLFDGEVQAAASAR